MPVLIPNPERRRFGGGAAAAIRLAGRCGEGGAVRVVCKAGARTEDVEGKGYDCHHDNGERGVAHPPAVRFGHQGEQRDKGELAKRRSRG